jgi:hypothetical protein
VRVPLTAVLVCLVAALGASADASSTTAESRQQAKPQPLPFRVVGRDGKFPCCPAPGHQYPPVPPEASVGRRGGFVQLALRAGRYPAPGYEVEVRRVTIVSSRGERRFRITARLSIPKPDRTGSPAPWEGVRIRRSAIKGRVPTAAEVIAIQTGLWPHTSFAAILSIFTEASHGGELLGAVLVPAVDRLTEMTDAPRPAGNGPMWYVRGHGLFQWQFGRSKTGYLLIDDSTGHLLASGPSP